MPKEAGSSEERLIVELDPGGPIELVSLTESFAGLARMYERHYRQDKESAPKLFVTRLESGSVIAEIVPLAVIFGGMIATMTTANTIAEFSRRLVSGIKSFADLPVAPVEQVSASRVAEHVSDDDAKDLREFVRPLVGKKGAKLRIKQARFEKKTEKRHIVAEYAFDDGELNRAAINIDEALRRDDLGDDAMPSTAKSQPRGQPRNEVMLFIDQASQRPGKAPGSRTPDRGVIPDVSPKSLPIHFLETLQRLKDQMIRGEVNPFTSTFVVDVMVQSVNGEPRAYIITNVRDIIDNRDDDQG